MHNIFSAFEKKYAAASTASRQPSDKLPVSNTLNYKRASIQTRKHVQCTHAIHNELALRCSVVRAHVVQPILNLCKIFANNQTVAGLYVIVYLL